MDITMPQLGETVTEGTITRWLKHVGDRVEADEPLFEVSTDKVDSEVPAPAAGYLSEIRVNEGETAAVGTVLAVVGDSPPAGAPAAAAPPVAATRPAAASTEPVTQPQPAVTSTPGPAVSPPPVTTPSPTPTPPAPTPEPVARTAYEAPAPAPAPQPSPAPPAPVAAAAAAAGGAALTSPIVRRLMTEHGLDPSQVRGTGEGGRITRKDVLDAAGAPRAAAPAPVAAPRAPAPAAPTPAPAPAPAPTPTPSPTPPPAPTPAAGIDAPGVVAPTTPPPVATPAAAPAPDAGPTAVVPFSNIRRRTAEHMVRSKATSAHVYTSMEVDFERIARVRAEHQGQWTASEGFSLTYLPFVARAFGTVVTQYPYVNASVGDDALLVHEAVNLGIAVDLDFQGLVAPVIRGADGKQLRLLAREIRDLADRARNKQLMPDEVLGATFTITNPGPYGTFMTLPIISQPQVAILSTDGIRKRPTVVTGPDGDDVIAVRHTGLLALTWDHRAFDGAYAAAFLQALQHELENRDWAAELY